MINYLVILKRDSRNSSSLRNAWVVVDFEIGISYVCAFCINSYNKPTLMMFIINITNGCHFKKKFIFLLFLYNLIDYLFSIVIHTYIITMFFFMQPCPIQESSVGHLP